MSEIYPETPPVPDDLPRDTSTWLGEAMQAASDACRAEHGYELVPLADMGNAERKGWAATVRAVDQLVGDRDMRIEIPGPVAVTPDPRCSTCDADPTELKPAKVIIVERDGHPARLFAAVSWEVLTSGVETGDLLLSDGDDDGVAQLGARMWDSVCNAEVILPADLYARQGEKVRRLDELRELLAEVLNDASPSPALAGWIERAQALGVKGWDGDPIGASLSDTIEEQNL